MSIIDWKKPARPGEAPAYPKKGAGVKAGLHARRTRALVFAAVLVVVLLAAGTFLARRGGEDRAAAALVITDRPFTASSRPLSPLEPQDSAAAASASIGGMAASISPSFYDFGTVRPRDVVVHDFYLRNEGAAPLEIRQAYTTCGCTTAEISAAVIPPGRSARLTVRFDAGFHSTAGQTVRRGLILETSDPAHPQMEIWVQASVREGAGFSFFPVQ